MSSIKEVAACAGVSIATVSHVINNKANVASLTSLAVRNAMAKLAYTPPPPERRRGPRPGKRKVPTAYRIALLTVAVPRALLNAPVYVALLHGVESALRSQGLGMFLHHAPDMASLPLELRQRKLDGLILFLSNSGLQMDEAGLLNTIPCVRVMGETVDQSWHDQITYRNDQIGSLAATYLLSRGHRHTAVVGNTETGLWHKRIQSFTDTLKAGGGTVLSLVDSNLDIGTNDALLMNQPRLKLLLDRLLSSTPRPTGLFLLADVFAPPVYLHLLRRNIHPGKDIEIVSCNNESRLLNGLSPRPATIDIHADEIGQRAVKQLLWRLEHPGEGTMTVMLSPRLIEGDSLSAKHESAS